MRIKSVIGYLNLRHKLAYYIKKHVLKVHFIKPKLKMSTILLVLNSQNSDLK